MEFSFDRSKDSFSRISPSSPSPRQDIKDAASIEPQESDTANIANERLRKAIERNRVRQAERNRFQAKSEELVSSAPQSPPTPEVKEVIVDKVETVAQASLYESMPVKVTSAIKEEKVQVSSAVAEEVKGESIEEVQEPEVFVKPRAQERVHTKDNETASSSRSSMATRRSVARPNEADFTPAKRTPKKVASQISYSTSSAKRASKVTDTQIKPNYANYVVKGCWLFCGLMVLRLIFASGGISDFYNRNAIYKSRLAELEQIKKENMNLVHEIEKMQSDSAFQKKLVRDNLGFIASDEFLVLFPKEKSIQ